MQPVTTDPIVFSGAWFARHQRVLLALLRTPVIGRELRDVLAIRRHDVGFDGRIVAITPHSYTVAHPDGSYTVDVRTAPKFARRLRHQLDPLWRAAHAWDQYLANPLVPALNAGFDTLLQWPDPGDPGTTTVDGIVRRFTTAESFATIRTSAGNSTWNATSDNAVQFTADTTSNTWTNLYRSFFTFDTSALTGAAVISAATVSLFDVYGVSDPSGLGPGIDLVSVTPTANNALTASDYSAFGTTSYTGSPKTAGSWTSSAYNAFTLNATGLAAVSKTGITRIGARESTYDITGTTPTWTSGTNVGIGIQFSDQPGSSNDPKLEITYTVPGILLVKN